MNLAVIGIVLLMAVIIGVVFALWQYPEHRPSIESNEPPEPP